MTKSSFRAFDMFNRLPIYSRPKEPAIGEPVLVKSTNESLSGRAGIQIVGFDGLPKNAQAFRSRAASSSADYNRALPQIPTSSSFMDEDFSSEALRRNEQPHRQSPSHRREPSSPSLYLNLAPISGQRASTGHTAPRRKPAPTPVASQQPIWDGRGITKTYISAGTDGERKRRGLHKPQPSISDMRSDNTGTSLPQKSGFGLGNLVKVTKATGRRKLSVSAPLDQPLFPELELQGVEAPVTNVRPANLVSIDDWMASREPHHKRSNTTSTVAAQKTHRHRREESPEKLQLRQSVFAPLHPPEDLISKEEPMPSMPSIPARFLASAPDTDITQTTTVLLPSSNESSPTTKSPTNESLPDRVSRLEVEQTELEDQKRKLRKDIYELEQLLPPNPSTHNPAVREQMRTRLSEINQQYQDVEKSLHEVGMRLHRAYRRLDKMTGNGPTHLWVSRVTARNE